jgi:hypothetical protein
MTVILGNLGVILGSRVVDLYPLNDHNDRKVSQVGLEQVFIQKEAEVENGR